MSGWDYPLGYPTITVLIMMFGSFQLLSVAALGQYIGRIYNEVKSRPKFIIDKKINFNKQKTNKWLRDV